MSIKKELIKSIDLHKFLMYNDGINLKGKEMNKIISKELLSAVIGLEVIRLDDGKYQYPNNDMSKIYYLINGTYGVYSSINIYELAHKCKEWALIKHGFTITSFIFRIDAYPSGEYDGAAVIFFPDNETPSIRFDEATISEAIFKACQWILDNKEAN